MTLAGSIAAYRFTSEPWFSNALGALCLLSIFLYFAAYIYFAFTDKDALRSEKYSIQKMAIQKGFIGDDQTGFISLTSGSNQAQPALPAIDSLKRGEDEQ